MDDSSHLELQTQLRGSNGRFIKQGVAQESSTHDRRTPHTPNSKKRAQVQLNRKWRIDNKEINSLNNSFKINLGREEITVGSTNVDLPQQVNPLGLIQFPIDAGFDPNVTNFIGANIFEGQSSHDFDMDMNSSQESESKAPDEIHVHDLSRRDLRKTEKTGSEKRERERERTAEGWRKLFKFEKFISSFLHAEFRSNKPTQQQDGGEEFPMCNCAVHVKRVIPCVNMESECSFIISYTLYDFWSKPN